MARRPRLVSGGDLHHVMQSSGRRGPLFRSEEDCLIYISILLDEAKRHSVKIEGYALLPHEAHLLLTPERAESLGRMMQGVSRRYSAKFSSLHPELTVRGALYGGRFRSYAASPEARGTLFGHLRKIALESGCGSPVSFLPGADETPEAGAEEKIREHLLSGLPLGGEEFLERLPFPEVRKKPGRRGRPAGKRSK